jgi:hypothetical protein
MDTDQHNRTWRLGPGLVAASTFIGIATGLGVTKAAGCVTARPWVLEPFAVASSPWSNPFNVLLAVVMLAFACMAAVTSRRIALCLMSIEFAGFVLFLFLFRGGYAVGIAGTPIRQVMQFDALGVAVRVGVLGLLVFGQRPNRRLLFRVALVGAGAALVIVGMKVALHPLPTW